jgi:hypothetical protein
MHDQVQSVAVHVEELSVPTHIRNRQAAQRSHRWVVRLQHTDRRHIQPRDDLTAGAFAQERCQRLNLG